MEGGGAAKKAEQRNKYFCVDMNYSGASQKTKPHYWCCCALDSLVLLFYSLLFLFIFFI